MNKKTTALLVLITLLYSGCTSYMDVYDPANAPLIADESIIDISTEMIPLTQSPAMFEMAMPVASGTDVRSNSKAEIDVSNAKDGYVMVKYLQPIAKTLKIQVKGPSGITYAYSLNSNGEYTVLPLSDGNGTYQIAIGEQVEGSKYAVAFSTKLDVTLNDEFAPFLRPNQYVNYKTDSETVKKAAELIEGTADIMEKITVVYHYVVESLTYDKDLAASITSGKITEYLPDVDAVLKKGKGICFDYAAVMTAMLRSQNIPTKLVVGYTGEVLHAWINTYSTETGWIDNVIYFDGVSWKLMDPTFASSGGNSDEVLKYIGNGKNYTTKFLY